MTSKHHAVCEPAPLASPEDDLIEITDDMIIELEPVQPRGKLLHFPPPVPVAGTAAPSPRVLRRRRGLFRIVIGN
jgi:hypothetical protein